MRRKQINLAIKKTQYELFVQAYAKAIKSTGKAMSMPEWIVNIVERHSKRVVNK